MFLLTFELDFSYINLRNSELDSGGSFQTDVDVISKVLYHLLIPIRELQGVVKQLVSCRHKRGQAQARLAELQKQTSDLPLVFPWPGLGERRQAVEQVRALLDRSTALAPVLSDVCTQVRKRNFSSHATEAENKMEQML